MRVYSFSSLRHHDKVIPNINSCKNRHICNINKDKEETFYGYFELIFVALIIALVKTIEIGTSACCIG